ncbi:MAG: hypothetical protein ISS87_02150 [Candidatus Pacebacteria bacterium]|nr:hypothetical protein [Candidatus Paceibacterota bacterium]
MSKSAEVPSADIGGGRRAVLEVYGDGTLLGEMWLEIFTIERYGKSDYSIRKPKVSTSVQAALDKGIVTLEKLLSIPVTSLPDDFFISPF